jgi:hypothetical protein
MAAAVAQVLITEYVYGGAGAGTAPEALQGTLVRSFPTPDAQIFALDSEDPKYSDGVRSKITYRNDPTGKVIYTNELAAALVAQCNGTVSAS